MNHNLLRLALLFASITPSFAAPPPAPEGHRWVPNEKFTDEFNGTSLDANKWLDHFPDWRGRPPAKFVPSAITVADGCLQISAGTLPAPDGRFTISGGAVRSKSEEASFGYYEARFKASKISMSSTFWLSGGRKQEAGADVSQEIDIVETMGAPHAEPKWAQNWHKQMNSNTHYNRRVNGKPEPLSVGQQAPLDPPAGEAFHTYGAWWVDATTVRFYLDDQYQFTVHPSTKFSATPFDRPMHVNMVCETYDWMAPPALSDLTNRAINTTHYEWVRAYVLKPQPAAGDGKTVSTPRIAGDYVNVYNPGGDVFPGPDAADLIAGKYYKNWVPNDHCFACDASGRWHAFGITHPLTKVEAVHAGEYQSFHALAPPGTLKEALKAESWKDLPKVLPPSERPGETPANHAPCIIKREGLFHMVYGPTPIRYAVSNDLNHWTPKGPLPGAPGGRDPHLFVWNDTYYLIVCGDHDVRVATSRDFKTWTERGPILTMKPGVDQESPFVVRHNNTFYLFVCGWNEVWDKKDIQGAYQHTTYVYQSDDPLKFEHEVAVLDAHAAEVFQDEAGDWFISSVEWPHRGVSIARLVWE